MSTKGFTGIPNAVMKDPDLPALARLLYGILLSYAWMDPKDWPDQDALAAELGVTDKPFRVALNVLREKGLVTTERRGHGRTMVYRPLVQALVNRNISGTRTGVTPVHEPENVRESTEDRKMKNIETSEGQSTSPAALNELVEDLVQGWKEPRPQRGGGWLPSPPGISDTQAAYVRKLGGQGEWWPAIHKAKRRHADIVVSLALSHLAENGMTIQNPFARLEAECGIVETEYLPAVSVAVEEGEWVTTPTR